MNETNQERSQHHTDLCAQGSPDFWLPGEISTSRAKNRRCLLGIQLFRPGTPINNYQISLKQSHIPFANWKTTNCCFATRFQHLTTTCTQFPEHCTISWDMNQTHAKLTKTLSNFHTMKSHTQTCHNFWKHSWFGRHPPKSANFPTCS